MTRTLALALALLAAGCQTVATQSAPRRAVSGGGEAPTGLFPADAEVLADEAIARILDARWELPEDVRIALLPLGHDSIYATRYGLGWYGASGAPTVWSAVEELRRIPGVYDVSFLPAFLLPEARSVALLREAAARYQADWVLLYSTRVSSDPELKLFGRDEVHGLCLVECALLDTRSGLIPFTARSTGEFHVEQKKGEELPGLILRAEQDAVDAAMLANAKELVAFVAGLREP